MDEYEMAGWQPVGLLEQRRDWSECYRDWLAGEADDPKTESSEPPGSH